MFSKCDVPLHVPQDTIENVSQFEIEIHSLIDSGRSLMRTKKTLVRNGEGFLGLLLGPVLEGLAELVLKQSVHHIWFSWSYGHHQGNMEILRRSMH